MYHFISNCLDSGPLRYSSRGIPTPEERCTIEEEYASRVELPDWNYAGDAVRSALVVRLSSLDSESLGMCCMDDGRIILSSAPLLIR